MKRYVVIVILALSVVVLFTASAAPALACESYSPGYWMNHPEAWDGWTWIGYQPYTPAEAIQWMQTPPRGDKSISAFFTVAAAAADYYEGWGGDRSAAFAAANAWVAAHPPGSKVAANSPEWQSIEPTIMLLDATFE